MNEQLSLCDTIERLQSFSDQIHHFKKAKHDVLKERTNTLNDLSYECRKRHQPLSLSVCQSHCNITGPDVSPESYCLQESRAVLSQECKMTELFQEMCNSDMEHTATCRRYVFRDGDDSCADTTKQRDIVGADVNGNASCSDSSDCGGPCLSNQARGHNDFLSLHVESHVLVNRAEGQQTETAMGTHSCCRRLCDIQQLPVYPRPLNYTHILTRRQFENRIKSIEGKVSLDVEDILSSSDDLPWPDLRTRSMKGKRCNLKKLIQDIMSYPTVVLHRMGDKIQEKPL